MKYYSFLQAILALVFCSCCSLSTASITDTDTDTEKVLSEVDPEPATIATTIGAGTADAEKSSARELWSEDSYDPHYYEPESESEDVKYVYVRNYYGGKKGGKSAKSYYNGYYDEDDGYGYDYDYGYGYGSKKGGYYGYGYESAPGYGDYGRYSYYGGKSKKSAGYGYAVYYKPESESESTSYGYYKGGTKTGYSPYKGGGGKAGYPYKGGAKAGYSP